MQSLALEGWLHLPAKCKEVQSTQNLLSFKLSSQRITKCYCPSRLLPNHLPVSLPPAAPGFTRPPLCAEEAALRRALEHADGDHSSLIQIYEAFVQSKWLTLHPQRLPGNAQSAHRPLCAGRGGPWPGVVLCASLKDLIIVVSFLLVGGADEVWCQARGLNWAALCQARKLREELVELMQRIELPLSQPAFGSEQNRRDLQKALLSGFFLKVGEGAERDRMKRHFAWGGGAHL